MSKSMTLCIVGALLIAVAMCDAAEVSLAAGVDAWSSLEVSSSGFETDLDTDVGFSLGLEVLQPVSDVLRIGGGVDYLIPRSIEDADIDISFLTGFFVARWAAFGEASPVSLLGRIGYGTWDLDADIEEGSSFDEKGGLYLALGATYDINERLGVEVLAMRMSGELETAEPGENFSDDIDYDMVSVRVRYRF